MVDNSKQLEVAENAIETYLVGRMSTAKLEEILSKSFSACTFGSSQREFRFVMCEPDSGSAPFGMRVFPEMAVLQSIAESAVVRFAPFRTIREMWAGCKSWVVEMDARLFDSRGFGMNHKELVACILHEMGHTVFSARVRTCPLGRCEDGLRALHGPPGGSLCWSLPLPDGQSEVPV